MLTPRYWLNTEETETPPDLTKRLLTEMFKRPLELKKHPLMIVIFRLERNTIYYVAKEHTIDFSDM